MKMFEGMDVNSIRDQMLKLHAKLKAEQEVKI